MRLEEEIKQKKFRDEYHKAVVNIIFTFNWLDGHSRAFFKAYNLTPQQFNILRILRGQHPKACSINVLRDRMLDKNCDASRLVERLVQKNLVLRKSCAVDRRAVDIHITEEGLHLLKKIDEEMDGYEKMMYNLSKKEVAQLNILLDKLRG